MAEARIPETTREDGPHVWWVNQGHGFLEERAGGYIEAGLTNAQGHHYKHWDALTDVAEGDLLVHYRDGSIRAIGRATDRYTVVERADGTQARQVPVEHADLDPPVPLAAVAPRLHLLNLTDGPLVQNGTAPKQGYLWPFSMEGLRIIQEASTSAWPAWASITATTPRAWILQADPASLDHDAALHELSEVRWTVRQHATQMQPGDRAFLWVSGADAGILALGTIQSAPSVLPLTDEEAQYRRDPDRADPPRLRVPVHVDTVFPERIRRRELLDHAVLGSLSILVLGQGADFAVTPEQAAALLTLVRERTPADPPAALPWLDFDSLLQIFEDNGLYFDAELVANYLLALQTKRFVILTGISGTGKTQLALAVARAFQPQVPVTVPRTAGEGAVELQVMPYMIKYHRAVLPAALRSNLTLPVLDLEKNSALIDVIYPGGHVQQRFYRDPDRPVTELLFSGPFREWFEREMEVGGTFHLDVIPRSGDAEAGDQLRVSLPVTDRREELLDNYRVVAVRPDWTDNRGLLGYHNPLAERYNTTPLLDLLLRAHAECDQAKREGGRPPHPFFLILDEMNLAHVEHYFSDFLSAMESGAPIDLHADALIEAGENAESTPVPRRITVPPNVFFTGTVNIDETTSMFSPKVLDRAFTIELDQVDLAGYGAEPDTLVTQPATPADAAPEFRLPQFPGKLLGWQRPTIEHWKAFGALLDGHLRQEVVALHVLLSDSHRHFGFRVANEVARYVTLAAEQAGDDEAALRAALDLALLQKVLPKFHGAQQELEGPLVALFTFLVRGATGGSSSAALPSDWTLRGGRLRRAGQTTALAPAAGQDDDDEFVQASTPVVPELVPAFPRSAAKVWRMLDRLRQQGFTSFIE